MSRSSSWPKATIFAPLFQSIPNLYNGSVKPFVVYVKPPPLEVLKETRKLVIASQTDLDLSAEGLKSSESVDDKGFTVSDEGFTVLPFLLVSSWVCKK